MSALSYSMPGRLVVLHKAQGHAGSPFPFPPTTGSHGGAVETGISKSVPRPILWEIGIYRDDDDVSEETVAAAVLVFARIPVATAYQGPTAVATPARWVRVGLLKSALDTTTITVPYQQRTYVPIDATRLSVALVNDAGAQVDYAGGSVTGLIVTARGINQP